MAVNLDLGVLWDAAIVAQKRGEVDEAFNKIHAIACGILALDRKLSDVVSELNGRVKDEGDQQVIAGLIQKLNETYQELLGNRARSHRGGVIRLEPPRERESANDNCHCCSCHC